jgi:addiction module RelE/StbE family toxin
LARIAWHPDALTDIDDISSYIALDSPSHAKDFAQRLFASAERLRRFPKSGRVVRELDREDVREIIVGDYRMIYRLRPDEVEVDYIVHGARLLTPEDLTRRER